MLLLFYPLICLGQDNTPTPGRLKSAAETGELSTVPYNFASNGTDDAYIYFNWSGFSNACVAFPSTSVTLYDHNGNPIYTQSGGNCDNCYKIYVGPEVEDNYFLMAHYTGWFCDYYSDVYEDNGFATKLYKPRNVRATFNDYDNKIVVSWDACNTAVKAADYKYRIYRDGAYLTEVNSSTLSYTDYNIERGVEYVYGVETYSPTFNKISDRPTANGKAFDLNVRTESLQSGVRITWNSVDPLVGDPTDISIKRRDGDNPADFLDNLADPTAVSYVDQIQDGVPYPGYSYMYIVTPRKDPTTFRPDSALGTRLPNGIISGTVEAPFGGAVVGVMVTAERIDSVPQGDTITYSDTTNSQGEYEIRDIYYYTGANFKVTPYLEEHGFDPGADTVYLDLSNKSIVSNFTDTSSFTILGKVFQIFDEDTCGIKDVEILINDIPKGYKTDENGLYSLTVGETGNYTFKPQLHDHLFNPSEVNLFVDDDLEDIVFVDTTLYTLEGKVLGPCGIYIGNADLRIYSTGGTCFDTTITSDDLGNYSIDLPARDYFMKLVEFYPDDPEVVTSEEVKFYFTKTESVDLTESGLTQNWTFRKDPVIVVSGFVDYGCGNYNVPILQQGQSQMIYINVKEIFGDSDCNTDTGFVVVRDDLVDGDTKVDTIYLVDGQATYTIVPGAPNFIAPYKQLLEITVYVEDVTDTYSQQILVVGNEPRTSTFATVSPEVPFIILRDPPGDGSYSYLSEGTTSKYSFSLSVAQSGSLNLWAQVKLGAKYEAGQFVFTEFEVWGQVKNVFEIGASLKSSTELGLTITNGQEFSTSGDPGITGEDGDIFAGAALNIEYALTDILEYDPDSCKVMTDVDVIMGVTGFKTTFIYTENHIQDVLIPQLEQLRDIYLGEDSDSAKIYENQINAWQQILELNKDLKEKAKFIENKSFSAGASYESYSEITKSLTSTIEYSFYIEQTIAIEAGFEVAGIGASGGAEIKGRIEMGGSVTSGIEATQKTGYKLNDDDEGDFFSVDILEDRTYGTPVFDLVSGRSSCPWEEGTQPREGVRLTANTYLREIENPDDPAVFTLQMSNTSESDEDQTYNLVFLQQSNPDGAALTLGGSEVQGGIPTPYNIPAGSSVNATVTVSRGQTAYDYNNLRFVLESGCDGAISDEVALSVRFNSPCSPISTNKPLANWIISEEDNNVLPIVITDYDTNNLEVAEVQYSRAGANAWTTIAFYDNSQLEEGKTSLEWILDNIADGLYDIRSMVKCESSLGYSDVITGLIDRRPPKVFGKPEPTDGIMDEGDLVTVTFDEPINCINVSPGNVTFTNLDTEDEISTQVGCSGDKIIILPNMAGLEFENNTFRVDVIGIEDVYGNVMKDTVSWLITVGGPEDLQIGFNEDTDGDSIPNNQDNCPLAYNPDQNDLDDDNMGDQCDPDIEGDGIDNYQDNCPLDSNFNQSNIDGDLLGDLCDPDMDGDGILNALDNCQFTSNITQADADSNGIGDACDASGIAVDLIGSGNYLLYNNYPNPFSDFTNIVFEVTEHCRVTIRIYNILGEEISILMDDHSIPGKHVLEWNSENYSDGIYFYSMHVRDLNDKPVFFGYKKMIIAR